MKKALLITVSLILIIAVSFMCFAVQGAVTVIEGYSLNCGNGSYMIIEEDGSPVRYSFNKAFGTDVKNLNDGDRILIISDLINESYPGSTSAHFILRLSDGNIEDIPKATLTSLAELGWYNSAE